MSRKFHVTIEIEMHDSQTTHDAAIWATSVLVTSFKKRNPTPRPVWPAGGDWQAELPMPPSEHPYRPKVIGAVEVAQPTPRNPVR